MKILITGARGMLGRDLIKKLHGDFELLGIGRHDAPDLSIPYHKLDLAQAKETAQCIGKLNPKVILHAAAMTDVDGCESRREEAYRDNVTATENLVDAANQTGAQIILISTDYVFDGSKKGEYLETDKTGPLNYYGETKRLAEKAVQERAKHYLIVRTSWLYGIHGKSFPRTIYEKAKTVNPLSVVSDQIGRPTFTADLADAFGRALKNRVSNAVSWDRETIHVTNDGSCSWADFAREILKSAKMSHVLVKSIPSAEMVRPAKRPLNSVLSLEKSSRLWGFKLRPWQEAVREFISQMVSEGV